MRHSYPFSGLVEYLYDMMLQMCYIVIYEVIKCYKFAIPHFTFQYEIFFRNSFYYFNKLFIVRRPKTNQLFCRQFVIIVIPNPIILIIKNGGPFFKLHPYKSLMIIGSTVNKMTQNFLLAPYFGRRFYRKFYFVNTF